jgi:hypothetical protein
MKKGQNKKGGHRTTNADNHGDTLGVAIARMTATQRFLAQQVVLNSVNNVLNSVWVCQAPLWDFF